MRSLTALLFLLLAVLVGAASPFSSGFNQQAFGPLTAAPSGAILSSGYFTVNGNQFLDGSGNSQRFACTQFLGAPNDGTMAAIRQQGQFNCVVIDWRDQYLTAASPPNGCNTFAQIDVCVANASANNLKVILSHRGNEIPVSPTSPCWSRQANGLPYDSGGDSGNDDGCNDGHNVTYVQFLQNTVSLLQRYNNNSTVIGYQIHHEPVVSGTYTGQPNPNTGGTNAAICWNCGNGDTDWLCIAQEVGNDVALVNAGVIEFVPGPINKTATLLNGQPLSTGSGMMDLSPVANFPVGGGAGPAANKVAYAADLYPSNVTTVTPDSGSTAITAWNTFFGFIEKNNTAPVMFMETGCSCDGSNGALADDQAFMNTFVLYVNGLASGGPSFAGRSQPMSINWYAWGNLTSNPNGILNADTTLKTGQETYWGQMLFVPSTSAVATTWNPNDSLNIALSSNNNTATSTASTGSGGVPAAVRSTTSYSTGKICFEITASTITNDWDVGLATANYNLGNSSGLGSDTNGIGFDPNFDLGNNNALGVFFISTLSQASTGTGDANGAKVTICEDFGAKLFWVTSTRMRALGSTWNNSPTANPATGTGGLSTSGLNCPCFIAFNEFQPAGVAALNTAGPFAVATPSGFSAWDTPVASTTGRPFIILGMLDRPSRSH